MDKRSNWTPICRSTQLNEKGSAVQFRVYRGGRDLPAFVIRYAGQVRAYLNRCGHLDLPLEIQPGAFFDTEGKYLICAVHGALYDPLSGLCLSGPCNGNGLHAVPVKESGGKVLLNLEHYHLTANGANEDL